MLLGQQPALQPLADDAHYMLDVGLTPFHSLTSVTRS